MERPQFELLNLTSCLGVYKMPLYYLGHFACNKEFGIFPRDRRGLCLSKLFLSQSRTFSVASVRPFAESTMFASISLFSQNNPAFSIYAYHASILTLKLCAVGVMTPFQNRKRQSVQGMLNQYRNKQRCQRWQAEVEFTTDKGCLNFLRRAQLADLEVIPIHLIIGLLYVRLSPNPEEASFLFGTFTAARLMCSMGFLPKCVRTAAFIWSYLDTALLAVEVCANLY